jgi:type II secretory pathway component PulJ
MADQASPTRRTNAFTLVELLVSMGVLVVLVFLLTQLLNSATIITILGYKRMDADSQARMVFDRMAVDFAQMVKRTDVDYYVKRLALDQVNQNDQIAVYSNVPGYYPGASPPPTSSRSPLSLVGYRVNSNSNSPAYNKLERLGKGLVWNGVSTTDTPQVFLPLLITSMWPYATNQSPDSAYEIIGPQVFRFEYDFLSANGAFPGTANGLFNTGLNGWDGVAAIAVAIAVIDPRSNVLLTPQDIATLNGNSGTITTNFLVDYRHDLNRPGSLINAWQNTLNGIKTLPRQAVSGVRVYERFIYLTR